MDDQTAGATSPRPTSRLVVDVVRALRGWVLATAGGVLILGCYLGVSAETDTYRQIPYVVSGGFFGLALVIVGSALLVADRIDAGHSQNRTAAQVEDLHNLIVAGSTPDPSHYYYYTQASATGGEASAFTPTAQDAPTPGPPMPEFDAGALYAVPTGRTFHRAYCELLTGKPAQPVDAETVAARTLSPCTVCAPSVATA